MGRARVVFAGREVEFTDRERAIKQVEDLAGKGTWVVHVIYGPEGCGKTAFLKQVSETLKEHGYAVVHVNPLAESTEGKFSISEELKELARELGVYLIRDAYSLIEKAVEILYTSIKRNLRRRIALLADDVFQAIGLDRAEQLVKSLLNMIEHPSIMYERIVVLVATSEGVTRGRIGRHRWADIFLMWNMSREALRKLYELFPDPKPPFNDVWGWTGGNPKMLEELYRASWDFDGVVSKLIRGRGLRSFAASLSDIERNILGEVLYNPDIILERLREAETQQLEKRLTELNLIIEVWERNELGWIDTPPPEKDPDLGIGRYYAWQTPIHREAVIKVLKQLS